MPHTFQMQISDVAPHSFLDYNVVTMGSNQTNDPSKGVKLSEFPLAGATSYL